MNDACDEDDDIGDLGWFALALIAVQIIPAPKKNQLFLTLEFDLKVHKARLRESANFFFQPNDFALMNPNFNDYLD